jgi:hypothetical protein
MSMPRVRWDELPTRARAAIIERTGPVRKVETVPGGANSGFAARVHTASDVTFVKGVPTSHVQLPSQLREVAINPYLPPASPKLRWNVRAGGWDLLGYECVLARHADYAPGSRDLPLVAAALAELQAIESPPLAQVKNAVHRWAAQLGHQADGLAGTTLLHTDLAPHNVLIIDRAHLIDWAWPTRGAAWIDPALLVPHLMEAGHTAYDADQWARRFPSWAAAPRSGVNAFVSANARVWAEIAAQDPQPWKARMAQLTAHWAHFCEGRI